MHVCLIFPYDMSIRNFLETPLLENLEKQENIQKISIISRPFPRQDKLASEKVRIIPIVRPFCYSASRPRTLKRLLSDTLSSIGFFLHLALVFRFNSIKRFNGFYLLLKQSLPLRKFSIKEGIAASRWLGFPFPRSKALFKLLYTVYYSRWQCHSDADALIKDLKPDVLVLTHLQNFYITPYLLAVHNQNIPVIGINGSWDQPTTKGPLAPFIRKIIVQNQYVKDALSTYHDFSPECIPISGWPQLDILHTHNLIKPRKLFLEAIGLEEDTRYILLGAYTRRLGSHEYPICLALAKAIEEKRLGINTVLCIRPHPLDTEWKAHFHALESLPQIKILPPAPNDAAHFYNLVKHASVVISSASTIGLDAVALDTPAIALAFEDDTMPYYDRPARRFSMEHYETVMKTGGIHKVTSQEELEESIIDYLNTPDKDKDKRVLLRNLHLVPLDGKASERIVRYILNEAK